jgi:hypothetical protein
LRHRWIANSLKAYVRGVVGKFGNDPRVLAWDVWNEPSNTNTDAYGKDELKDKQKYVLKLYRRGLKPKSDVIEILRACSREHVIEIVDWGESDGLWFEMLEYGRHGTLRDLFQKGPVKDTLMLSIVREEYEDTLKFEVQRAISADEKKGQISIRIKHQSSGLPGSDLRAVGMLLRSCGQRPRADDLVLYALRARLGRHCEA